MRATGDRSGLLLALAHHHLDVGVISELGDPLHVLCGLTALEQRGEALPPKLEHHGALGPLVVELFVGRTHAASRPAAMATRQGLLHFVARLVALSALDRAQIAATLVHLRSHAVPPSLWRFPSARRFALARHLSFASIRAREAAAGCSSDLDPLVLDALNAFVELFVVEVLEVLVVELDAALIAIRITTSTPGR